MSEFAYCIILLLFHSIIHSLSIHIMKNIFSNFLVLSSLIGFFFFLAACEKNEEEPDIIEADLHHDSVNLTAPFLDPSIYEAAARFSASETSPFVGKNLVEISFFIQNLPDACEVRVYGMGTDNTPGELLYTQDVSGSIRPNRFNRHFLNPPLPIPQEDIWLSIRFSDTERNNIIGCDAGPAQGDGDWIYDDAFEVWLSFREYTNQEASINWNIRGHVD